MTIFRKLFSLNADTDSVVVLDFHIDHKDPIVAKRAATMEEKRQAAKAWLGEKWILHPVNKIENCVK